MKPSQGTGLIGGKVGAEGPERKQEAGKGRAIPFPRREHHTGAGEREAPARRQLGKPDTSLGGAAPPGAAGGPPAPRAPRPPRRTPRALRLSSSTRLRAADAVWQLCVARPPLHLFKCI